MKEFSESDLVTIEVSSKGRKLREPVIVRLPRAERPAEKAVIDYVIEAFTKKMPRLIKLTFENKTTLKIAKYLLIHKSGSHRFGKRVSAIQSLGGSGNYGSSGDHG